MGLIAWRNIMRHKMRTSFLALCVVIGVSFVAGTFVLTDTLKGVYTQIFDDAYKGVAVSVRSQSALGTDAARPPVPETILETVRTTDGVGIAEGNIFTTGGRIFGADDKQAGNPYAPTFLASWPVESEFNAFTLVQGVAPVAAGEVVVDLEAATQSKFAIGDDVRIQTVAGMKTFRLVGIAKYGTANSLGGASAALFDLATAQAETQRVGLLDDVSVAPAAGVDVATLQSRVQAAVGPGYEVVTGADLSAESSDAITSGLSFFSTILLVFAAVSLFVGAFIVYNTFAIVVAQRTREMALLRSLGADGEQVIGSILLEAVIIGLLASAVGLVGGVALALGLKSLLGVIGFDVPSGDVVVLPRTILVSVTGGVLITVVSAIGPAVRAARVAPLAAVRAVTSTRAAHRFRMPAIGTGLLTVGIAGVVLGASRIELSWLGGGAISAVFGVALLAPTIVAPFVAILAAPVRRFRGVPGQLAQENASHSARRTATTASALMIGTALIAAALVLASSINTSTERILTQGVRADLIVSADGTAGIGPEATGALRGFEGVAVVAPYRWGVFRLGDATENIAAMDGASLDPTSANNVLDLDAAAGSIDKIDQGGVAVSARVAKSHGWSVGDVLAAEFATGAHPLRIEAIYKTASFGDYMISLATHEQLFADSTDMVAFVRVASGASVVAVKAEMTDALAVSAPAAKVQDRDEYAGQLRAQVNQLLSLITALVMLAVIIALLGVLITMLLSVMERTHEIGLLRAIGMDRSDVRAMVRWEAAIIATFGATLGVVFGVGLGFALTRALRDRGISTLEFPYRSLVIMVLLVTLAGVGASLYPARRAARLDVLRAIATV